MWRKSARCYLPPEPFKFDGVLSEWKCQQYLRLCKGMVLDYGCHTGDMVKFLSENSHFAYGYDSDPKKIAIARAKYRNHTFWDMPPVGEFGTVIAWNVLEHIEDDESALRWMIDHAHHRVVLSVPKEDDLSLPDSRVTYRPYVDPTHKHYYTVDSILSMVPKGTVVTFEHTTRVRPLLAYTKLGIPKWLCSVLDNIFWAIGRNKDLFHANLIVVIDK